MKIHTLDDLRTISDRARAAGKTIVLAHGTFDLLHYGHVKHLQRARSHGDLLVVTVTADQFVNRGPGRPVFNQQMRAEMLASLAFVDHVGVNAAPTAIEVLDAVRPNVYVKGSDYTDSKNDPTGNIAREQEVAERHGGRLVFTNDVTFSSSSLLNRHFDVLDPEIRNYLSGSPHRFSDLSNLLDKIRDYRVVIVGDTIIDDYQYVGALGKSAKENMIATLYQGRELFAGGVIAAANHVANFCREVTVLTTLGEGDEHEALVRQSLKPNVILDAIYRPGVPTTRKCRFVDNAYLRKLFEVYFMDDKPLADDLEGMLIERIRHHCAGADVVIATDFGHGLLGPRSINALTTNAPFLAVNTQTNSANVGYNPVTKYKRADYVCIDAPEARLAVGDKIADLDEIVTRLLPDRIDCQRIVVTNGRSGCVTQNGDGRAHRIPAFTRTVVDTVGAGDAFLAVTAPLMAAGGTPADVSFIGNAVGALKVGIVGHRNSIERPALLKYLETLLK